MKKFLKWMNQTTVSPETKEQTQSRTLFLNGTITEESWFDDDITPQLFKEELNSGVGDITVWINSPGGDCVAAAQIYNMLMDYKGNVAVKIDGIAASAASVIAMAGTKVLVSLVKFKRDIFKDLSKLESAYNKKATEDGSFAIDDLEIFENVAYHADRLKNLIAVAGK